MHRSDGKVNKMTRSFNVRPKLVILLNLNINYTTSPPAGALPQTPRLWRGRSLYAFSKQVEKFQVTSLEA